MLNMLPCNSKAASCARHELFQVSSTPGTGLPPTFIASDKMADIARRRRRALWRVPFIAKILARPPPLPKLEEVLPQDPRLATGLLPCGARYMVHVSARAKLEVGPCAEAQGHGFELVPWVRS